MRLTDDYARLRTGVYGMPLVQYMYSYFCCIHLSQIPDLIDGLHLRLAGITTPQTRTGTLRCMRTICNQYLVPTVSHLLDKPLPWDE